MNQQLSLFEWSSPFVQSASNSEPVVLHRPELCARCDTFGRAMCVSCKDAEAEEKRESQKPLTPEEVRQFFSGSDRSPSRPR